MFVKILAGFTTFALKVYIVWNEDALSSYINEVCNCHSANLPNISAKLKINCGCQMVAHLSIIHGLGCLTSVIWPFTLTALIVASCLYCALLRPLTWESYNPFMRKKNNKSLLLTHPWNGKHLHWSLATKTMDNTKTGDHLTSAIFFSVWLKY